MVRAGCVPPIWPKAEELVKFATAFDSAVPEVKIERDPLGAVKFVWLMTLKASKRIWNFMDSKTLKSFATDASKSTSPGCRMESRGTLPKPEETIRVRTPDKVA